jgi:Holliday junction resolvase RusA-like endonuclease
MSVVNLVFDIDPVAKSRPRFNGRRGKPYTPANTKNFEMNISRLASPQIRKPLEGALKVTINFLLRRPKSVTRKYPLVKPDIDNFIKSLLDGLNGIAFKDDAQVTTVVASKYYATSGRIEVKIETLK